MTFEEAIHELKNTAWLGEYERTKKVAEAVMMFEKLYKDYKDCRNELCLNCGKYKTDECKDCRWKECM